MNDDDMVIGWDEIRRRLFPRSRSTLMRLAPELRRDGVVFIDYFGRTRRAWCYGSSFKLWMMLRGQKKESQKRSKT